MGDEPRWPDYMRFAIEGLDVDRIDTDDLIAAFSRRWGGIDTSALRAALERGGSEDRIVAIRALSRIGGRGAWPLLEPFLASSQRREMWQSAMCLGAMRDVAAAPVLREMATDDLPPSIENFVASGLGPLDDWHRLDVAEVLADLGDQEAVPALRRAFTHVVGLLVEGRALAEVISVQDLPLHVSDWSRAEKEQVRVALTPGTRIYLDAHGQPTSPLLAHGWRGHSGSEAALLVFLLTYLDELAYALGRLGDFGVVADLKVPVPEFFRRLWDVHLMLGSYHERLIASALPLPADRTRLESVLANMIEPSLQSVFGWDGETARRAISLYIIAKGVKLRTKLSLEQQRLQP